MPDDIEPSDQLPPEVPPPDDTPPPAAQPPVADQQPMFDDLQARMQAAGEAAGAMPADQGEALRDMAGHESPSPEQIEPPELAIEPPDLGSSPLPDFRSSVVPEGVDLNKPVTPRYIVPPGSRMKPPSQERTFGDMQSRMQRPGASARAGKGRVSPQPQAKYEPAQQLPDDPLFDDDQLTDIGSEQGSFSGAAARNREAQAAYLHEINLNLELHTQMIVGLHREIDELRTALERYRG